MTILNRENDGLPSILTTLSAMVAKEKAIPREELLKICVPISQADRDAEKRKDLSSRANGTILRWTTLGLFEEHGNELKLSMELKRGESADLFSHRLRAMCRRLVFDPVHGKPLWPEGGRVSEEGTGLTADFCRGLAWCLSQDVYTLPTSYAELETLITEQVKPGRFIFLNDTRWPGLRDWAKFLGFATGDDSELFFDPTEAIRSELPELAKPGDTLPAADFVTKLSERLPVLDYGFYRREIENALRPEKWAGPPVGYLSVSLSFALRRLQKQGVLSLEKRADAESLFTLTRQGGRVWESFTHVSLSRNVL